MRETDSAIHLAQLPRKSLTQPRPFEKIAVAPGNVEALPPNEKRFSTLGRTSRRKLTPMKVTLATPFVLLSLAARAAAAIVVDNIVDPGDGVCGSPGCTLREAITAANGNPGADIINFNIPGAGVHTITPTSPLPTIIEAVTIDGYTQPGASENTLAVGNDTVLLIELDGTNAGASPIGLNISSDGECRSRAGHQPLFLWD